MPRPFWRRPRARPRPSWSPCRGARSSTLPPAKRQVATARPSTRAKGRKMPLLVTSILCGPTTSSREVQPSRSGSKAPSRRGGGSSATGGRLARSTRPSLALDQLGADRGEAGAGVAQRQARPAGEVAVVGRAVADQVAAGQLGQGRVAVDRLLRPEPVARPGRRRAPCRPSARGRRSRAGSARKSRWTSAWPSVRHPGRVEPLAQLRPGQRPLLGQRRARSSPPRARPPRGMTPSCAQAPARCEVSSGGVVSACSQRVVLAADQVQGAAVEPGDQQRAVLAQRPVDVGRGEAGGAGADRQPGAARVLPLHGEQALGDGARVASSGGPERPWAVSRSAIGERGHATMIPAAGRRRQPERGVT